MADVLGSEWGPLAGMPAEEGLKILSKYANDLESRLERDDDVETPDEGEQGLTLAKNLKRTSVQPAATEFVSKRAGAIAQARQALRSKGKSWDEYGDYVEQIMAGVDANQQLNAKAWEEAWWYCWGVNERNRAEKPESHPRSDADDEYEVETRGVSGNMNTDRSRRSVPRDEGSKYKIEDPEERRTKGKFEKYLGIKMSDEEWIRLQDENIKTYDDYKELQDSMKQPERRVR